MACRRLAEPENTRYFRLLATPAATRDSSLRCVDRWAIPSRFAHCRAVIQPGGMTSGPLDSRHTAWRLGVIYLSVDDSQVADVEGSVLRDLDGGKAVTPVVEWCIIGFELAQASGGPGGHQLSVAVSV